MHDLLYYAVCIGHYGGIDDADMHKLIIQLATIFAPQMNLQEIFRM